MNSDNDLIQRGEELKLLLLAYQNAILDFVETKRGDDIKLLDIVSRRCDDLVAFALTAAPDKGKPEPGSCCPRCGSLSRNMYSNHCHSVTGFIPHAWHAQTFASLTAAPAAGDVLLKRAEAAEAERDALKATVEAQNNMLRASGVERDAHAANASLARQLANVRAVLENMSDYEPNEVCKDDFAYDRMVENFKDAARQGLAALAALAGEK